MHADLIHPLALPFNLHSQFIRGRIDKVPDTALDARGDDEVLGRLLLQHQPLHLNIVPGVSPVAPRIEIAEVQAVLQTQLDTGERAGDFAGDEGLTANRRLVIEQDAIAGVNAIGLAIIYRNPVRIKLGDCVRTARVKRCRFILRRFLDEAIQFRRGSLVVT